MVENTKWVVDPSHTEVSFRVRHLMISNVTGYFRKFDGELTSSSDNLENASVLFEIDVNSIDTNDGNRDNHLRSADFFDVENHPKLTIKSDDLKDGKVNASITMRGTTKDIPLEVEFSGIIDDPYGNKRVGYEISGEVNRKEFGLNWSSVTEAGGVVVGDKVKIYGNVQFVKQ